MVDKTPVFDPMIYDALLELATRIGGRYVAWADRAQSEAEARHWLDVAAEMRRGVRQVDSFNEAEIEAKRQELRELWRSMPVDAPQLTA